MKALDKVNQHHGRGRLRPANLAEKPVWGMRRQKLSPAFTTSFDEMMRASA